ncbi:hypothetical protein [Mesorhizobium sp. B2-1-3]|uniref:hypothetical protein n=1 Tax=Mesorhizobium sp. B2-1-3 TaxID=2589972 RepID=UPI0015E45D4D|nr:hypothetical protein [Mesorhizobium sp. B2-1-3]
MVGIIVGNRRQIALRLTPVEFAWVEKRAAERGVSINEQICQIIRWGIDHTASKEAA